MRLGKKQIWPIFLLEFKVGCKAVETTCNINNAFGPGTANKCTVRCSRSFAKETRALQMRSIVASHQKLTTTNWEPSVKLILLRLHEKLRKNSVVTIPQWFSIWSNLERWNSSISGSLMSWRQIKKIIILNYCLLFYATTMSHFSIGLWCAIKSGFCMTTSDNWLGSWTKKKAPKHFPKSNLHQKKVMVTVWWSAARLIHYSFLNPGETMTSGKYAQQIDEMHQKLQPLQPALVNRRGQNILHDNTWPRAVQPTLQKLNELGCEGLPHLPYSPDLTHRLPLVQPPWQLCAGKMLPQPAECRKCCPRVHWILKYGFLS